MRISARNQIKGTVKAVREGAVNAVVTISFGDQSLTSPTSPWRP